MSDEINVAALTITSGQLYTISGGVITVVLIGCRLIVTLYVNSVKKELELLQVKMTELEHQIDLQRAEDKQVLRDMRHNVEHIKDRLGNISEHLAVARDRLRISND